MSEDHPYTVQKLARHKIKIRRSVFVGTISPAGDKEEAEGFIEKIRTEFPDATHHCFAYRIAPDVFRYYDDGEPPKTAGLPILRALEKFQLVQTALIVTRFFGGVKLGTGGLSKAYFQCAEETILKAKIRKLVPVSRLTIQFPYGLTNALEKLFYRYQVRTLEQQFGDRVVATIEMEKQFMPEFKEAILSFTGIRILEETN